MAGPAGAGRSAGARLWRGLVIALLAVVTLLLLLLLSWLLRVVWLRDHEPGVTAFMEEQLERARERDPRVSLQQQWQPYERIADALKRAVIAAEDANFSSHDGIDWDAVERAYDANLARGKVVRGGSTITMQLAKNLFLSSQRSYLRKGQEVVIATMIEMVMDKRRILELYLNVAEWGAGVFGAEAAARTYYRMPAAALGEAQAARLAAMLPNPRHYQQHREAPGLQRRTGMILRGMRVVATP